MTLKDYFLLNFISTTFGILIVLASVEDNFQVIHLPGVDVGINSSNSTDSAAIFERSNIFYIPPSQNQSLKCSELSTSDEFSKHSAKVVRWFRNDHILKNSSEFMITDDELTLIVNSRSKTLEGKYFCRTEWKNYGIVVSPPVFVEFAGFENHKHEKKQKRIHAVGGSIAYVPCVAPRPKPSYAAKYWFVRNDGHTIQESLDGKYFLTPSGLQILISTNNSYDSGNYTCFVKNTITGIEHRGKTVNLLVSEVPKSKSRVKILAPSQKQTDQWVNAGENITMECVMHGHPSPLVVWEKYGGTLPDSRHKIIFDNLLLMNVSKEDEGTYLCKAEAALNVDLNEYSSQLPLIFYSLVVHEPSKTKISFEVDHKNEKLYHIQCESSSGSNEMSILFNGEDLLRKSRIVDVNTNEGGRKPRLDVMIHNVSLADGIYQCLTPSKISKYIPNSDVIFIKRIISNDTTSNRDVSGENYDDYDDDEAKETDSVSQFQQKSDEKRNPRLPIIFQKPENATDFVSSTVTFLCQIVGDDVTVSWLKNNRSIVLDHKFDIIGSGTLEIKNLDLADRGWYTCVASNSYGKTTATAFLNVEPFSPSFGSSGGDLVENTMFIDSKFQNSKERILYANAKVAEFPMSTTTLTSMTIEDDDENQLLVDHGDEAVLFNDENDKNLNSSVNESLINENNLQKVKMDAPKAYRLTNTSVMLKWAVPKSLSSTQTSVFDLQFRIQYKLVPKKIPWTTIDGILPGSARSFTIQNLTPGMKYKFRIGGFYKNFNFMSETSPKFLLLAQSAYPVLWEAPTILSVNATSSSTLHVFWMVISNDSTPVEGFIISYKRVYPIGYASGIHPAQNDTVIGSDKRDYLLQNLLPATPYDIRICAFNSDGPGHMSNSMVQTTKNHHVENSTSDGHFSPLSFEPAAPKPHLNESTKLKNAGLLESWWSIFGLSRDTLVLLIGFVTILVIILTIISSIALSVTKRQLKKRGLKNSKKKFSDTSKKIHYEYSFVRSKKKHGKEAATFYATEVPEYDSLNNLDNVTHSENENGGPKDQKTKFLSSSLYSSSNSDGQQKQHHTNLYSNPLNDLDQTVVDRQTLPSVYGDIGDNYMMHDVVEAPAYVAKDSILCKSVMEAIAGDRASSVASYHSADRNSNFLSAASHYNSCLKSPATLTTRFLTLTTNGGCSNNNSYDFSSNRIYSPYQQTTATLNQQRAGTLQPKSHWNRTSANNSVPSSSRKHFRSPSPRLPLPVPTPELRSLHYDCLLRSNLNTPSPSKDAQKFDYDPQHSPSQHFKNHCIYESNIENAYHSPKIFQNFADSPRSSSSTFRQLKEESGGGGSPISTSSKNFGSTFKPPRVDSCFGRNSNNSGVLNSYAQIINNSTNQNLTNKTIGDGDDGEVESMALYDWSEHILNTSGFGSIGQSEVR